MANTIYIWKPVGFTPLEIVDKFKEKYPEYEKETVSYAGRLDPMAEGILILLIGRENKNRNKYLDLKKKYESEIVLGISTDTYDSLGLITDINLKDISKGEIEESLENFVGKQKQLYPPYSSKAVNGKPLFWWARQGRVDEIKIPERDIEIYSIKLGELKNIKAKEMINQIIKQLKNIKGDFRQDEIIESWKKFERNYKNKDFLKIKIRVNCSSGTYIRGISDDLGKKLDSVAFAYSIRRTGIGKISEKDCLKII